MSQRPRNAGGPRGLLGVGALVGLLAIASPAFADDERDGRLGFQSDRGTAELPFQQLFSMARDGTDVRPLLSEEFDDSFDLAWSPDGRQFAFASILDDGYFEVHVARADGTKVRRVTRTGPDVHDASPAWPPRGKQLAFVSDRDGDFDIFLTPIRHPWATWNVTRNSANDCGCYDPFNLFAAPSFSPDGKRIAFTSDLAQPDVNADVYVINRDGSGLMRLTSDPGVDAEPDWSPDGRSIAFNSDRDGDHEIYVMNADGSDVRQVTRNENAEDLQPDWSPDGRGIAFTSDLGGSNDIWVMDADGSDAENLTRDAFFDERPAWQPTRRRHDGPDDDHDDF